MCYRRWSSKASRRTRRRAVLSGPAALHAEQVAQLQEEPVRRATQVAEPEGVGLRERCAVTQEDDRARRRLIGEQQVVAEVVRDDRSRRIAVHEQRLPGMRVEQRDLVLREILADVAHENGARQLVL